MPQVTSIDGSSLTQFLSPISGLKGVQRNSGEDLVLKFNRDSYTLSGNHPISNRIKSVQGGLRTFQMITSLAQSAGFTLQEINQTLDHLQNKSNQALSEVPSDQKLLQFDINQLKQNLSDTLNSAQFDQIQLFDGRV